MPSAISPSGNSFALPRSDWPSRSLKTMEIAVDEAFSPQGVPVMRILPDCLYDDLIRIFRSSFNEPSYALTQDSVTAAPRSLISLKRQYGLLRVKARARWGFSGLAAEVFFYDKPNDLFESEEACLPQ
ncbi:hypothetical protein AAE478_003239 [Parahypoxylon ruwenzoriense]